MATKDHMAQIGPVAIETVPITHFTKSRLTSTQLKEIWHICGPSAEKNLSKNPIWMVICMAYIEGLNHGAGLSKE
jgi:hypothetical protein